MKPLIVAGLCAALISAAPGARIPDGRVAGEVNVLLLVCHNYGANYNLIRDAMELRGWNITTTAPTEDSYACYYGGPITADILVEDIDDISAYDCLAIMPATAHTGTSHYHLLNDPESIALVARAVDEGLLVAACCGGTRVLAAADVIDGRRVTGHTLYIDEYLDAGGIWVGHPVPPTLDGPILTSVRNQFYCSRLTDVMAAAIDSMRAVEHDN